ncbi:hypothetical protein [Prosthecomicrobium sp. N25]|uniref:hypothetical protein n=1 Tax=Prosthecomicrobium sp. N25 TaxID=3129254 RepID=UPI003077D5A5
MSSFYSVDDVAGVIVVDPRRGHRVKFTNSAVERCVGYSAEDRGLTCFALVDCSLDLLTVPGDAMVDTSAYLHCRDGVSYEVETQIVRHFDRDGRLDFYFLVLAVGEVLEVLDQGLTV